MENVDEMMALTPRDLEVFLEMYFKQNPIDVSPLMLWGKPGIGKTEILQSSATTAFGGQDEAEDMNRYYKAVYLTVSDPTRLMGMPSTQFDEKSGKKFAIWLQPSELPHVDRGDCERGVLFLDELPSAAPAVQVTAHRLLHERRIEDYKLPDGWFVLGAGNRRSDKAQVFEMSAPLANRFMCHITVKTDFDSWRDWAYNHNIRSEILAFLNWKQGALLERVSLAQESNAFPTPRSWTNCSKLLDMFSKDRNDPLLRRMVCSCVGQGVGMEFMGFMEVYKDLPDPSAIMDGKTKMPKIEELNKLWALSGAFIEIFNANPSKYADKLLELANYISEKMHETEFGVFIAKMAVRTPNGMKAIRKSPKFVTFTKKHRDIFF